MIVIDGSLGEGGGQILRTSIAMSAVTKEPVKIFNIRVKRSNPGLRAQHLNAIKAVAELCSADVSNLRIGSMEVEFHPNEIKTKKLGIDIGTAGSITMVLQALMIPAMFAENTVEIQITGGTDVRWSPPIDYLRFVTLPLLRKFGYGGEIQLMQRGYYPRGGGSVRIKIDPIHKLKRIHLMERGKILSVNGVSHASSDLKRSQVAERQIKASRAILFNRIGIDVKMEKEYCNTLSSGSGITLWIKTENSILGSSSLGERGKMAEIVGREAAQNLVKEFDSNAPLDKFMADQIIPYLALSNGSVRVSEITEHARTNVEVVKKFGFDVEIEGNLIRAS